MSAVPWDLPLRREMNARRRLLLPGAGGPAVHGQGGGTRTGPVVLQGSREVKFGTQALREDSGFACSPAQSRLSVYQGDSGLL